MNDHVIETNDLTKCVESSLRSLQLWLHVPKGKIYGF